MNRQSNESIWVGEKDGREWRVEISAIHFPFHPLEGEEQFEVDFVRKNFLHDPRSITAFEMFKVEENGRVAWDRNGQRYTLKLPTGRM